MPRGVRSTKAATPAASSKATNPAMSVAGVSLKRNRDHTFGQYFNKQPFSDFEVYCKDQKWLCHKVILAAGSPFFEKMFEGKWKKENEKNCAKFPEEEPDLMEALLLYCYDSDWKDAIDMKSVGPVSSEGKDCHSDYFISRVQACKENVRMHRLADVYGSRAMQLRALAKFTHFLVCDSMLIRNEEAITAILEMIYAAQYSQAKELREALWDSAIVDKYITQFAKYSSNRGEFHSLAERNKDLTSDFMNALVKNVSKHI